MKTKVENIIPPSLEEIRLYHAGKLSPSRSHEIELLALENELVADAMEGYAMFENWNEVPSAKSFKPKGGTPWFHLGGWIGGLVLGVLLALWLVPLLTGEKNSEALDGETSESQYQKGKVEEEALATYSAVPVDSHMVTHNEDMQLVRIRDEEQVFQLDTFQITPTKVYEYMVHFTTEQEPVAPTTPPGENVTDTTSVSQVITIDQNTFFSNSKIYHINDYKVVDYRELRHNDWEPLPLPVHGTPANFETQGEKNQQETSLTIPYFKFVGNAVQEFAQHHYQLSLSQFETILEQYPGDVNAQFYGGLCCFHLKKYERAEELFKLSMTNEINTFKEDAEFYLAKTYLEEGKTKYAQPLISKIIARKGHYAPAALKLQNE